LIRSTELIKRFFIIVPVISVKAKEEREADHFKDGEMNEELEEYEKPCNVPVIFSL